MPTVYWEKDKINQGSPASKLKMPLLFDLPPVIIESKISDNVVLNGGYQRNIKDSSYGNFQNISKIALGESFAIAINAAAFPKPVHPLRFYSTDNGIDNVKIESIQFIFKETSGAFSSTENSQENSQIKTAKDLKNASGIVGSGIIIDTTTSKVGKKYYIAPLIRDTSGFTASGVIPNEWIGICRRLSSIDKFNEKFELNMTNEAVRLQSYSDSQKILYGASFAFMNSGSQGEFKIRFGGGIKSFHNTLDNLTPNGFALTVQISTLSRVRSALGSKIFLIDKFGDFGIVNMGFKYATIDTKLWLSSITEHPENISIKKPGYSEWATYNSNDTYTIKISEIADIYSEWSHNNPIVINFAAWKLTSGTASLMDCTTTGAIYPTVFAIQVQ